MANHWTPEQIDAIESEGQSIIVSAGAGSGKTAVLTERVIRKLKQGVSLDQLLILTFTKAAAAEMKERIRAAINKEPSLHSELEKVDSAYITTFDSYALSIVKRYHYVLNLSPNISIIEASVVEIKKREILDKIFDNYYQENNSSFQFLIHSFCIKDDNDIKTSILSMFNKLELLDQKEEYLDQYLTNYYNENNLEKLYNQYLELIFHKCESVKYLIEKLEDYTETNYSNSLYAALNCILNSSTYEEIKNGCNIKLPMLPKGSSEEAKQAKEELSSVIKEINSLTIYETKEEIITQLIQTKSYVSIIIDILKQLQNQLMDFKKEKDQFEFHDIAFLAIAIVRNYPHLAQEIKESLNEIMIDEYQDTNDLQEIFISYISNNNVYMVGDIKQSIYRFRNANPYIFKNKYDSYKNFKGGKKIDLNKNFRSRKEVLEDINQVFDKIMDNELGGAAYTEGHQMVFGNLSYEEKGNTNCNNHFEILNYDYNRDSEYSREEIEIFTIAYDIINKIKNNYPIFDKDTGVIRPIEYSDFVILMDRTTKFDLYKQIFQYLEIPLTIYKDQTIQSGYDIDIMRNILIFIDKIKEKTFDNEFNYCFVSIARSYLFNLDDNVIFETLKNKTIIKTELFIKASKIAKNIDYLNISDLIEQILKEFNFYEKLITVGSIEESIIRFDYLLDLSDSLSNSGYQIKDFINYMKILSTSNQEIKYSLNTSGENSVKIMTIHKSKGLEYPICYYSGLYAPFNLSDIKERFIFSPNYGFIVPTAEEGIRTTIIKELLKEENLREEISEKIRLFYVALTRSKEKMILVTSLVSNSEAIPRIIPYEERLHYRSFQDMLLSIVPGLDRYLVSIDLENIKLTKDYRYEKKIDLEKLHSLREFDVTPYQAKMNFTETKHFSKQVTRLINQEEYSNLEFGRKIHEIFELIDFKNPDYSLIEPYYQEKIKLFLEQPIFDNVIKYYKEYEFYEVKEEKEYHGIIDLILEYKDRYAIIDYKLKHLDDKAYQEQLNGYQNFLNNKTNKLVEIYLYSILDNQLVKL